MEFASCSNEEGNLLSQTKTVQLSASINNTTGTRIAGTQWEGSEQIGLYMINGTAAEFTPEENVENRLFNVDSNGKMTAANSLDAVYPADGSAVKFVAYYPYSATTANNIYQVDLADENVPDHDLIYAAPTTSYDKTQGENAVTLAFDHQLSKLVLNFVDDNDVAAQGVEPTITRSTQAQFNLSTGTLSAISAEKALAMPMNQAQAVSLILPGKEGEIVFTYNSKKYIWDTSTITFEKDKQYVYTLKLAETGQPENPVIVVGSASITNWTNGNGSVDLGEDEEIIPVNYAAPVFTGTLQQEAAISDASLKVDYTDGNGATVNVTTEINGAGAQGINIVNKQITLDKGNGSFTLDISGTPSATGDVTFTISVEGAVIGSVNATVAEKAGGETDTSVYTSNITLPTAPTTAVQTNAYGGFVEINGTQYSCLKLGSSKSYGVYTTETINQGATKLSLHIIGWNAKNTSFKITINNGGTINGSTSIEDTVESDPNMTQTASPYAFTVDPKNTHLKTYTLSGLTNESTITIETIAGGTDKRTIAYGLNIE